MGDFNSLFPNFTTRCAELRSVLMPVAYLFMVIGMVAATAAGRRSAGRVIADVRQDDRLHHRADSTGQLGQPNLPRSPTRR